jgi:hypothetical protein
MSRDLAAHERTSFETLYGVGAKCRMCGDDRVTIRIWEKYGATAYMVGGDIGPTGIVAAVVICEHCGHGQIVPRYKILQATHTAI